VTEHDLRQGDVWWAQLPPPVGRRPVVILTRTSALRRLTNVMVAPLTRTIRGIETEAILSPHDGVPELSAANLDNIMTIPRTRLDRLITHVSNETMADIHRAVRVAMEMPAASREQVFAYSVGADEAPCALQSNRGFTERTVRHHDWQL
jgi:mRNA interferase MazF